MSWPVFASAFSVLGSDSLRQLCHINLDTGTVIHCPLDDGEGEWRELVWSE